MPGLCQEPTSNCTRKEFLESLDLLPLEEQSKPLWLYFSGDSTGRQLCVAFMKHVAGINLGTFTEVKEKVAKCDKTPQPDEAFKRFVNAQAWQIAKYRVGWNQSQVNCNWNATFGQKPVRFTLDWRRFLNDPTNDLHLLEAVAEAGRWPTAWVVTSGVHDCEYLRRNVTWQTSSVQNFFRFLNQHPILKSRTVIVGMEYMVDSREQGKGRRFSNYSSSELSLHNCSRRLHKLMLLGAREHGVYMIPRWKVTRDYEERNGYDIHYPEPVILNELPSLLTGLSCMAKSKQRQRQHVPTSSLNTAPPHETPVLLLHLMMCVGAVTAAKLVFRHRKRFQQKGVRGVEGTEARGPREVEDAHSNEKGGQSLEIEPSEIEPFGPI